MRYLILADIHGNMPALEAVLASPEASSCKQIISLGDQVNYGPQSREVLERLASLDAVMLLGNHEERLLHLSSPDLQGYNWAMLHWTAQQLGDWDMHFPVDLRIGSAIFTHGIPGDPYTHFYKQSPDYLDSLPADITHLFCGHSHKVVCIKRYGRMAVNPGSVGAGKNACGGIATFAVFDSDSGVVTLHEAPYNVDEVGRAFIRSGAIHAAPMMCRMILQTLYTGNENSVTALIQHIQTVGAPHGLTVADEAGWLLADSTFPWTEPLTTPDYWMMMEDKLL